MKCPKCGHTMISSLEEEYIYRENLKPLKITYDMHHCPNCMELIIKAISIEEEVKVIFS